MDEDDWALNYIGHPISGAAYYTVARNTGFSKMESFGYSTILSTFFWEYGIEAFAETPSTQDLFITPILGSLLGEAMFSFENKINDNNGYLFGSKRIGNFVMALMNPAEVMIDSVNNFFNHAIFTSTTTYFTTQPLHYGDSWDNSWQMLE